MHERVVACVIDIESAPVVPTTDNIYNTHETSKRIERNGKKEESERIKSLEKIDVCKTKYNKKINKIWNLIVMQGGEKKKILTPYSN